MSIFLFILSVLVAIIVSFKLDTVKATNDQHHGRLVGTQDHDQ